MLWDNGILSSVASINQIGSLSILGASHKYLYTSLINSGTISQNISGYTLFLNQSANINNSGIYEFQAGEIRNAPNSVGVFNNSGTFRKTSSGLSIVSVPFYNTGTVNVELGTLLLLGGGSSNGGIFNISSGGTLEIKSSSSLTNNTYFLDSNAQINGTGTLMISGGFLELARDWAFPTTTINILWSAGIKSSGTVTNPGSLTIQNSAYLYASLNNTGTITHLILRRSSPGTVSSLSLNQSANINNSGIYEFQSGELDNEIRNAPNSVGVFNNSGTFRKTNAGTAIVSVPFYNTGTVNVELGTLLLLGGGRSNGGIFNISRFGTLELKSAGATLTNNTYLLDSNTQINGTGTLMISGGFLELDSDWTLPTTTINILRNAGIKSPGTITNAAGLTIQGNAYLYASLNNTGTIVQNLVLSNPSDRLSLNQSANINNSGIYEFQAGEIRNQVDSIGVFNNSGTFRKTSSGLSIVSVPFYNTGTVNVELGTLLLLGGGRSNGGIFNISRFGTLELKSAGATLTNNTYLLDSNTQINGTGTLMISGGFLELDSDWTLPTTTINILRNAGIKSPGTITNAAGLTIQGNAYLYASLNNTGTIVQNLVLSNPSDRLSLNQSANINNSGIYEFQAGEIRNQVDSIGVFNNSGTFRKTSSGLSIVSVPFYNTGTIESVMGTVSFYNSYTHNNANLILKSGNVSFTNPLTINGGNIEGNGNINATITNSGLLNPRYVSNTEFGRLTINGNYTETNNASINIQLGGNTAAVNFDQIDINGTANFDGTLNVSLLNGFTPTLGSTFDVLTYDALNSLSNLDFTGLDINSTLQFLPQWSSNKLTLKVVDKSAPILAIAPTNVVESESHSGTKPFTFTVTRSVNTTGTNNVNWAVTVTGSGSNPANATDFAGGLLPSGVVSFAAGETSKVITVNVQGDTTVEPNETFRVTLSNPTNGATITTATAIGTIQNDDFIGTSGPDTLAGTSGADAMTGLAGNDTYTVNNAGDLVIEALNQGTDTVQAAISYTLPNNVENLLLTGTGNLNGTGNALNNQITGNSGNNNLNGAAGTDTLIGGTGNDSLNGAAGIDTLTGGVGTDIFIFQFSQSTSAALDRVTDFAIGDDKIDLLSQAGGAINAPVAFTRAANSTTTNINTIVTNVFTDANGATAGNQALGTNSAALVRDNSSSTYLIINDGTAGFQSANDLVINLTGLTGAFPALGTIAVNSFFV
ncbi:unknown protein [Microcystis aeruginosa NIES-843]|uniref:Calx-beta domain-containing protein n=3 Tax=Microcystis aeruginosa TaxID=1126 RepID=B0JS40_MICAN|nr:unknown protein [Microcystis aeruginosa NIES-843]